jgi:hypothetical protein
VTVTVTNALHDIVSTLSAKRITAVLAFAIGLIVSPAGATERAAPLGAASEWASAGASTDLSARRKLRRYAHAHGHAYKRGRSYKRSRFRHAHHRGGPVTARRGAGRIAGLAPDLRGLIADLQARHGADSVRVISGRDSRGYSRSCHPSGQAFDAHVSRAAMADLRSRHYGLITYSGGMHHVHVSSCSREAGLRAHKRMGGGAVYARYMGGRSGRAQSRRAARRPLHASAASRHGSFSPRQVDSGL